MEQELQFDYYYHGGIAKRREIEYASIPQNILCFRVNGVSAF
jgi:hypothetical protein